MTSYVASARQAVEDRLSDLPQPLIDLYTLLVMVKGADTTLRDVHDAWSVWVSRNDPEHRSLLPFDLLAPEVQQLDQEYRDAIGFADVQWRKSA